MKNILNIQATLERIDNDKSRLDELYQIALLEFPKWRSKLKDKVNSGDFEQIRKTAHTYKGSTATLGAEILQEFFFKMESAAKVGDIQTIQDLYNNEFEAKLNDVEKAINDYNSTND
jgi:HPt (histidine-containing phosphotransfer) domain-containing protein